MQEIIDRKEYNSVMSAYSSFHTFAISLSGKTNSTNSSSDICRDTTARLTYDATDREVTKKKKVMRLTNPS